MSMHLSQLRRESRRDFGTCILGQKLQENRETLGEFGSVIEEARSPILATFMRQAYFLLDP